MLITYFATKFAIKSTMKEGFTLLAHSSRKRSDEEKRKRLALKPKRRLRLMLRLKQLSNGYKS